MKKIKIMSIALISALFGMTSCEAPEWLEKVPLVNKLIPSSEDEVKEKEELKPNNQENQNGENQQGQGGNEGGGNQGGNEGGGNQGGNEGGGNQGGGGSEQQVNATYAVSFKSNDNDSSSDIGENSAKILEQVTAGSQYISGFSNGSKVYAGKNGLKFGTSSAKGQLTINFDSSKVKGTVSEIQLETAKYSSDTGKFSVKVGSLSPVEIDPASGGKISVNAAVTSLTIETTSKRAYLKGLSLKVGEGSSTQGGGNEGGGNGGGGSQGGGGEQQIEGIELDFSVLNDIEGTSQGISFAASVGDNSNNQNAQYNEDRKELRLYIGNELTISSSSEMTAIHFIANTCGESKADGTLESDKGEIVDFVWEGSATSVTFKVDSGKQVHISKIIVATGEGGGTGGEGGEHVGSELFNALKAILAPICADMYQIDVSEITYESYPSEEVADIYYYDTENLTYLEIYNYSYEYTFEDIKASLIELLPEEAIFDEELSYEDLEDAEDLYIDYWYEYGQYYIVINLETYVDEDEEGQYTCSEFFVTILSKEQYEEYVAFAYPQES